MIAVNKNQVTSVEILRRELKYRFQDELVNGVQGPSDELMELVIDPEEKESYPLFFSSLCVSGKKKASPATRRGPSRSGGVAEPTAASFFPPLTSTKLSK